MLKQRRDEIVSPAARSLLIWCNVVFKWRWQDNEGWAVRRTISAASPLHCRFGRGAPFAAFIDVLRQNVHGNFHDTLGVNLHAHRTRDARHLFRRREAG